MKKIIPIALLSCLFCFTSCSKKTDGGTSEDNSNVESEGENNNNNNNSNNNNNNNNNNDDGTFQLKKGDENIETVELDCGLGRTSYKHDSSIKTATYAAFPSNVEITASIPSSLKDQVRVEWSIPSDDGDYFTLSGTTGESVTVTATNPSRLSKLTAKLIKTSDNSVVGEDSCELRSVMINTYWYGEQKKDDHKICGIDIGSASDGYSARFYTSYGADKDIVFPSKLKSGDTIKNVVRIVGLAESGGLKAIGNTYTAVCRYFYVPNTVYITSGSSFCFVEPKNSPIFQAGGVGYTYFDDNSFAIRTNTIFSDFVDKLSLENGTFPYNKYAEVSSESSTPDFKDLNNIEQIKDKSLYATKLFLKKA